MFKVIQKEISAHLGKTSRLQLFPSYSGYIFDLSTWNHKIYSLKQHSFNNRTLTTTTIQKPFNRKQNLVKNVLMQTVKNHLEKNRVSDALNCFQHMRSTGLRPSEADYIVLLKYWKTTKNITKLEETFKELKNSGETLTESSYSLMISAYAQAGKIDLAKEFLQHIKTHENVRLTEYSYVPIAKALYDNNQLQEALDFVQQMNRDGIPQSKATQSLLLAIHKFHNNLSQVEATFEQIPPHLRTVSVMNTLMSSYVKNRNTSEVFKCFAQMEESGLVPDGHTLEILLYACIIDQNYFHAVDIFKQLQQYGVSVSERAYILFYSALYYLKNYQDGLLFFEEMLELGIKPSSELLGKILSVLTLDKDFTIEPYLTHMRNLGIQLDQNAYVELIKRSKNADIMLSYLQQMKDKGLQPSLSLYHAILSQMMEENKDEQFKELYRLVKKEFPLKHDAESFQEWMRIHILNDDMESLNDLLLEMHEAGVRKTLDDFHVILQALAKHCDEDAAVEVFEDMKNDGVVPDEQAYNIILHLFAHLFNLPKILVWLENMTNAGFKMNPETYSAVQLCLLRFHAIFAVEKNPKTNLYIFHVIDLKNTDNIADKIKNLIESEYELQPISWNIALRLAKASELVALYKMMKAQKIHNDLFTYYLLMNRMTDLGDKAVISVMSEVSEYSDEPVIANLLLMGYRNANKLDEVVTTFRCMERKDTASVQLFLDAAAKLAPKEDLTYYLMEAYTADVRPKAAPIKREADLIHLASLMSNSQEHQAK